MKKFLIATLLISLLATSGFADEEPGAAGALTQESFTLEEMLRYAIEDEWLAEAEYAALMAEFDVDRPFSNIRRAELTHIDALLPLFETYDVELPVKPDQAAIPDTLAETYQIGVDAEIANIAMYEKFLAHDNLPADISAVFTRLMNASKNHLKAFERQVDRSNGLFTQSANGFGRRNQNGRGRF